MPRTPSPASRPAAPLSGAGSTAGRALRPAAPGAGGTARRRLDNAESTEDVSPSWICWLVPMVLASYISYELLAAAQNCGSSAMPGAPSEGSSSNLSEGSSSNLIYDAAKRTIESFLAEDPAKGLASSAPGVNAYKSQSGDVVETLEKLLLRCRVLSSLLNASLCTCRPSQGETWPMCALMSVVGRP